MLDDLKYIHQRDKSDALGIAQKQLDQFLHTFECNLRAKKPIHEIIFAGMGGSGLAASAYKRLSKALVPISVVQDYRLPARVNEHTLVVCISYSGNTEETLSIFNQACDGIDIQARPMIATISSGGALQEMAGEKNIPHVQLPSGFQPRFTFGYQYRAILEVMNRTKLVSGEIDFLEKALENLAGANDNWLAEVATAKNLAKQIALDIVGKAPVIYASSTLYTAAYKWKINCNENAKNIAWCGEMPELNHNEFLGWTSHPIKKPYAPIFLISDLDHPQVQKRYKVTEKLLSGKMPHPISVDTQGESKLEQIIWAIMLGDFVSLYLALLNNIDPTPVTIIEKLKSELK